MKEKIKTIRLMIAGLQIILGIITVIIGILVFRGIVDLAVAILCLLMCVILTALNLLITVIQLRKDRWEKGE
ncbi:MAG: hypothetical protein K2I10_01880 [Lachnospiraceae bacterium]|nr:hypothetical protein [Lachnospiraceae bacterium]